MTNFYPGPGYIKLYRKVLGLNLSSDEFTIYVALQLMAAHEPVELRGGIKLERGQVRIGRIQLSQMTGINEHKIDRILKRFQGENILRVFCEGKYRIISLTKYNCAPDEEEQTAHIQELQEEKEKKESVDSSTPAPPIGVKKKKEKTTPETSELLDHYAQVFAQRHGRSRTKPLTGKQAIAERTMAKKLIDEYGLDRAKEIVKAYVDSADEWTFKNGHPFTYIASQLERLFTEMESNRKVYKPKFIV